MYTHLYLSMCPSPEKVRKNFQFLNINWFYAHFPPFFFFFCIFFYFYLFIIITVFLQLLPLRPIDLSIWNFHNLTRRHHSSLHAPTYNFSYGDDAALQPKNFLHSTSDGNGIFTYSPPHHSSYRTMSETATKGEERWSAYCINFRHFAWKRL